MGLMPGSTCRKYFHKQDVFCIKCAEKHQHLTLYIAMRLAIAVELVSVQLMTNLTFMNCLILSVPPKIITEPRVSDIYGNEMVNFTVSFLSLLSYTEIIWLKDSVPIHTGFEVHYQNSTTGTSSLAFNPLTRADEGLYTVRISNNSTLIPTGRRLITYNFRVNVKGIPLKT